MQSGRQTWLFDNPSVLIGAAAVGADMEGKGPLANDFDCLFNDAWGECASFEKAEQKLLETACLKAVEKAGLNKEDIDLMVAGDLLNQITASNFTARSLGSSFLGVYGACSTSAESLAIASLAVSSGFCRIALAGTGSHNCTAEKQFRYPNEYGAQKPPASQHTATAAGAGVIMQGKGGIKITSATIGRVIDYGISDAFNMGAAMAPAAVDTIIAHLKERNITPDYYDVIVTGDLGAVGHACALELLHDAKIPIGTTEFTDCGMMLYDSKQQVFSGGSGAGCSAAGFYGHFYNRLRQGSLKKMLLVATGALLSPLSFQQHESIPGIAHAVSVEVL